MVLYRVLAAIRFSVPNEKAPRLTTRSLKVGSELFSRLFYVAASRFNSPRQLSKRIEA
jgi:hypothetical protein